MAASAGHPNTSPSSRQDAGKRETVHIALTQGEAADKLVVSPLRRDAHMEQIHITLPDGSVKDVPKGTTAADVARSISPRLADAALVARVAAPNDGEGELIDLRRPLDHDVKLHILTERDPDALFVFRHSAAQ